MAYVNYMSATHRNRLRSRGIALPRTPGSTSPQSAVLDRFAPRAPLAEHGARAGAGRAHRLVALARVARHHVAATRRLDPGATAERRDGHRVGELGGVVTRDHPSHW